MNNLPTPEEIHRNAVEHGWWEGPRHFLEMDALGISELSEAFEEYRNQKEGWEDRFYTELADFYIRGMDEHEAEKEGLIFNDAVENDLKIQHKIALLQASVSEHSTYETIPLLFNYFNKEKIIEAVIKKHEYNKTRPYRHGNKKC